MERYIALLDILGFKEMIFNNNHEDLVKNFDNFRIYLQRSLAKGQTKADQWNRLVSDMDGTAISSTIISDSIIFWTKDNSASCLIELVNCLHDFLRFCHNKPFLFLRGGITGGNFHYENTGIIRGENAISTHPIMLGKALVEAYEIEKKLQIAGCIISEGAINLARDNQDIDFQMEWNKLIPNKKIIQYNMPEKNGTNKYWTINWVDNIKHPTYEELKNGFMSFNKKINTESTIQKVKNTLSYYEYIKTGIYQES